MRKQIVSCAVFLLAMSPAIVFAAPPQIRRGFWLSFGLGYGSARVECDQCIAGGREGSLAGWFRLGGTIGHKLLLGWEVNGWLKNDKGRLQTTEDLTRSLGSSAIIAVFYPRVLWLLREGRRGIVLCRAPSAAHDVLPGHGSCLPRRHRRRCARQRFRTDGRHRLRHQDPHQPIHNAGLHLLAALRET
jgi:hypothetical protein